jgi:predicted SnoaL-like aldol condensation-catalyzing enzyme
LAIFNRAGNYQFEEFLRMNPQDILSIAYKWFDVFNNHNLEQLLSLYDDHAQHFSPKLKIRKPETNGLVVGKEAMREWWKDAFDRLPTLHYKVNSLTANSDRVFMEYVRTVEGEPEMLVAEVLDIREGKITQSRVYHG